MYDIQNALRRRAMAERLEALNRADEATSRAAESPDTPIGPRHRAHPSGRSTTGYSDLYAQDDTPLAHEAAIAAQEPAVERRTDPPGPPSPRESGSIPLPPQQPSAHATPTTPFPSMPTLSGPSPSPYAVPTSLLGSASSGLSPYVAPAALSDGRSPVASAPGGTTALDERTRTDTLVDVHTPDQTARLDVSSFRPDTAAPPPLRAEADVVTPTGVTLLRTPAALPTDTATETTVATTVTPSSVAETVDVIGLDPVVDLVEPDLVIEPGLVVEVTEVAEVAEAVAGTAVEDDTEDTEGEAADPVVEDDDPVSGSSAATIADLLRHGTSRRLFFNG
jgi:hypothetical protein